MLWPRFISENEYSGDHQYVKTFDLSTETWIIHSRRMHCIYIYIMYMREENIIKIILHENNIFK